MIVHHFAAAKLHSCKSCRSMPLEMETSAQKVDSVGHSCKWMVLLRKDRVRSKPNS